VTPAAAEATLHHDPKARAVRRRPAKRHPTAQNLPRNLPRQPFIAHWQLRQRQRQLHRVPTNTPARGRLGTTHAGVQRSSDSDSDCRPSALSPTNDPGALRGPHGPPCRVVAWMRAVRRRLSANVIVVGDSAAAAGYLVVELGLTPRSAWLRIARCPAHGRPRAGAAARARDRAQ